MMRHLRLRAHRDDGLALVVALVVTLLVFLLTTAILADAFHNVVGSANARERLTAINAAEAGVSWYSRALESSGLNGLRSAPNWSGGGNLYTSSAKTVSGSPGTGTFTLTARYWRSYTAATGALADTPCASPCLTFQQFDSTTAPAQFWVELTSAGSSGGVTRTVRTVMELRPLHATLQGAFAGIFICELGNRFTITGPYADLYLLGDGLNGAGCPTDSLRVTSGQFSTTGSVYVVNGSAYLTNTSKIDGSLWAKGPITLGSGGSARRSGRGSAAQCSSQVNAQVLVCGDVTSLDAEPELFNTAMVLGIFGQCVGCALPELTFPQITTTDALATFPWTNGGALSSATLTTNTASASQLYHTGPAYPGCSRFQMAKGTLYLRNDTAIISGCGFEFGGRVEIRPAAGVTTTPTLYLITGYSAAACATDTTKPSAPMDGRDIVFQQNFDATAVRMFIYTPCKLIFTNQTNLTGQLIARTLYAQGRSTINTTDLLGLSGNQPGPVSGFQVRVLNLREL